MIWYAFCMLGEKVFPASVEEDDVDLPFVLARINEDTGSKFVIIIDEWDAIFRENKNDEAAQKEYIIWQGDGEAVAEEIDKVHNRYQYDDCYFFQG